MLGNAVYTGCWDIFVLFQKTIKGSMIDRLDFQLHVVDVLRFYDQCDFETHDTL